jgi:drug/metabolite transporter (DMT)-like permease
MVREDGSGGKYTGRSSATRALNVRIEYRHSIRSAITVAGTVGQACNNSRIRGSTTSTTEPVERRRYAGGRSAANAFRTVFFEQPNTRAITFTGIRSARCSRRISAQSSTLNTHFPLTSTEVSITAFVTYAVLAGGNAVGVRFSNRELAPLWGAGLRFALAAALLVAVMVVFRLALPWGRALVGSLLYGLFNFAGSFGLTYYGLVQLHAGLGQILLALVPLATLLLAVLWRQERLGGAAVIGTLLALAGVAVISYSPLLQSVPLLSVLAVVGGAICFAQALVLVRRFPPVHPVTMNAIGMTTGAAVLLAAALVAGEPIVLPHRPETWAAMAYLVVIGSVVVFLLYLVVLRYWAASRASYGFVIIPFVTLLLSAWLDNEPVGLGLVVGGLLVLAGVYIGALHPARVPRAAVNAKTDMS